MTRRTMFTRTAGLLGAGAAARLLGADAHAGPQEAAEEAHTGTTLILLGTQGGPNVNLLRAQASNAVLVDGAPYLVDCGYGTLRALAQARIPFNDVRHVFLTHLHDDHTLDVAALLSLKWTGNNATSTTVRGPLGTQALLNAALAYLKPNADIRVTDEGRPNRPETFFTAADLPASTPTEVFRDERVRVRAVDNTHFPERAMHAMSYRSLAYRFDTADRSIVFSGDTAYSENLVTLARNADILVCETIEMPLYRELLRQAEEEEAKTGNRNGYTRHIVETHVTTEDVGRMAAAAGVGMVVLSHLLPGANPNRGGERPDSEYADDVRRFFKGEVIVGKDQMRL